MRSYPAAVERVKAAVRELLEKGIIDTQVAKSGKTCRLICKRTRTATRRLINHYCAKVTIDEADRLVLTKTLRDELHLAPGDTLDLTVEGEQVTLRRRSMPPPQKERGTWVFRTSDPHWR